MLNVLIFLSIPDVVIVMTLEDRVKNTSLWSWIGEFLVRWFSFYYRGAAV